MKLFSNDPKKTRTQYGKNLTQKSWFRTEENLDFEDSFKFWFALMWQNMYIFLFLIGFIATTLELAHISWIIKTVRENFYEGGMAGGIFTTFAMFIMPLMLVLVCYKGFWQYWDDIKRGRSR